MHACGHDGHVAMGLAVARRLAAAKPPAPPLRFLFQPAEEGQGGAQACADDGVLEGVGAAFGLHLWSPLPVGKIGVNRGALMAAVDHFEIDVEGRGGHGAAPHETADPIVAAARIVEALQTVVSREISPLDAAVVTIGSIHGGTAFNIIPGSVRLTGTARSFTEATGTRAAREDRPHRRRHRRGRRRQATLALRPRQHGHGQRREDGRPRHRGRPAGCSARRTSRPTRARSAARTCRCS